MISGDNYAKMNEMQREVLKRHHMDLIRDIIVTEELLGECYQNGLFDTSVIDFIRVKPAYPWLSETLKSSFEQLSSNKVPKYDQSDCLTSRSTTDH
ncbi:hypothetical protein KUTeg_000651, partial [Tegillarca granosa]